MKRTKPFALPFPTYLHSYKTANGKQYKGFSPDITTNQSFCSNAILCMMAGLWLHCSKNCYGEKNEVCIYVHRIISFITLVHYYVVDDYNVTVHISCLHC